MPTLEPLPLNYDPFAAPGAEADPRLEPLPPGTDPFVNVMGGGAMTAEGVGELLKARPRSALGLRARAVNEVPGPTPEDEMSPIDTADIIEGRQRIADAEAQKRANSWLKAEMLPEIGMPIRIANGSEALEGIVTDAWDDGDEPGIAVEAADGMFLDVSLPRLRAAGVEIQELPAPRSQQDIDKEAQDLEKARQKEAKERVKRHNPDGSISTEVSITVPDPRAPGRWMNIPSMYEGIERDEDEAVRRIMEAGFKDPETDRPIRSFASLDEAVTAAEQRSGDLGKRLEDAQTITDLTKIASRALPAIGPHHAAIGIKRRNKAVASIERGIPNADYRLLEKHGIAHDPASAATFLGAVNKAKEEGKSPKAGTSYATEILHTTASQPDGMLPPKFHSFLQTQIGFALKVPKKEVGKLVSDAAKAAKGTPGMETVEALGGMFQGE